MPLALKVLSQGFTSWDCLQHASAPLHYPLFSALLDLYDSSFLQSCCPTIPTPSFYCLNRRMAESASVFGFITEFSQIIVSRKHLQVLALYLACSRSIWGHMRVCHFKYINQYTDQNWRQSWNWCMHPNPASLVYKLLYLIILLLLFYLPFRRTKCI